MKVRRAVMMAAVLLTAVGMMAAAAQDKQVSASGAWVAEPEAGSTSSSVYAVLDNPSMYEVFVVKVSTDAAGAAEIVRVATPVPELSIPAYGSTELTPGGVHIVLKDLKRPLEAGDRVSLTLTTDQGAAITVEALVKKPQY